MSTKKKGKSFFAKDLEKPNTYVESEVFILEELKQHTTRAGKPYYRIVLKDKTGSIVGRIWQDSFPMCAIGDVKKGDVVCVDFYTEEYNGTLQAIVTRLNKAKEYDLSDLVSSSNKDINEMLDKVYKHIDSITNSHLKDLLFSIFRDITILDKIKNAPAAEKVHHDYIGGLLEHTLEVLDIALSIVKNYPEADRDLVVAGVLLHDIGKIYEYEFENFTFKRSKLGYLIGHIVVGVQIVDKRVPKDFPEELKIRLYHIILSHHNQLEMGAVVRPATIEAAIVAMSDYASSQVRQFQKALTTSKPDKDGFGEYHKLLKTKVYFGNNPSNLSLS